MLKQWRCLLVFYQPFMQLFIVDRVGLVDVYSTHSMDTRQHAARILDVCYFSMVSCCQYLCCCLFVTVIFDITVSKQVSKKSAGVKMSLCSSRYNTVVKWILMFNFSFPDT